MTLTGILCYTIHSVIFKYYTMSKDVVDNDKSSLMAALAELSGTLITMARDRISEKVDSVVEAAIRKAVITVVIVLCTLFDWAFLL